MSKKSAGILMYRFVEGVAEVLLVHPGGPYWEKKDAGAWSIPKGEYGDCEDPFAAARREFKEETGFEGEGDFIELIPQRQPNGKVVFAWAVEGNLDCSRLVSNRFPLEWPPGSGQTMEFPEVDRCGWFRIEMAAEKILKGQLPFLSQLCRLLDTNRNGN